MDELKTILAVDKHSSSKAQSIDTNRHYVFLAPWNKQHMVFAQDEVVGSWWLIAWRAFAKERLVDTDELVGIRAACHSTPF